MIIIIIIIIIMMMLMMIIIIIINRFRGQNNNFARASHFFVHFFAVFAWST